jgi:hypothetical protein
MLIICIRIFGFFHDCAPAHISLRGGRQTPSRTLQGPTSNPRITAAVPRKLKRKKGGREKPPAVGGA